MKIGIDARMYRSSVAGIGRYSQNLIKNLLSIDHKNRYILFMTDEDAREFRSLNNKNQNVKIKITNIPHYSIAEQTKLPQIIAKEKCDLVHFLNFNYPVRYKGKFLVTIHDLTLFFYPETAKETGPIKRVAFRLVMSRACKNSAKIIAVSKNTKDDIIKYFKTDPDKIVVIPEAADDKVFIEPSKKLIQNLKSTYHFAHFPIILYVGQWRPHKNIVGLIEAFSKLKKKIPSKLVIIGKIDPKHKSVQETIDKLNLKSDIVMPGFVSNEELAAWYKIASVFVFPSFYEGFGLPGLEAMAAGTPVVASKTSSLPEAYQDAAIYFDPGNSSEIADKIELVLEDDSLRQDLIKKGKAQVAKYSWKRTAEETLKIYKEVIAN